MVWIYRSPIPVVRRGVFYSSKWFLPAFAALRGRGRGSAPCGHRPQLLRSSHFCYTLSIICTTNIGRPTKHPLLRLLVISSLWQDPWYARSLTDNCQPQTVRIVIFTDGPTPLSHPPLPPLPPTPLGSIICRRMYCLYSGQQYILEHAYILYFRRRYRNSVGTKQKC